MNVRVRPARSEDLGFLRQALAWAAEWREEEADLRALADPEIARYLEHWKRDGDFGVIAEGDDGLVGAAWWRHFFARRARVWSRRFRHPGSDDCGSAGESRPRRRDGLANRARGSGPI